MTFFGRSRLVDVLEIAALGAVAASAADAAAESPFARPLHVFVAAPSSLLDVRGTLYFVADDGVTGAELWKSDGTVDGTVRVSDIAPGPAGSSPESLFNFNGTLVFTADDGVHGRELWKSDGTKDGTVLVKDVFAGVDGSAPASFVVMKNRLYFAADDGVHGRELWTSDLTESGTSLVKDIRPGPDGSNPDSIINQTYTAMRVDADSYVYVFDGTLYFAADDGVAGREVWRSDGTDAGTVLFLDMRPGPEGSDPKNFIAHDGDGSFSFVADDGVHGVAPWGSLGLGIGDGTWMMGGIPTGADGKAVSYSSIDRDGNFAVFADADGEEPWAVTSFGAQKIQDIRPGPLGSSPRSIIQALGGAVFSADDGASGRELWMTANHVDPSPGAHRVADIAPGAAGSDPQWITEVSGLTVAFSADDGVHGRELWASDGTAAGTRMIADIVPGAAGSDPAQLTVSGTLLFFTAAGVQGGQALYVAHRSRLGVPVFPYDFDGDGFVDDVENAFGSSITDPESTPEGFVGRRARSVIERLAVRLRYSRPGADTAVMSGVVHAPRTFSPAGKRVFVDFGGVVRGFTLDARGVGETEQGDVFRFKTPARDGAGKTASARWSVKFAPTDLAASLESYGFQNVTARSAAYPLTFVFVEGVGIVFSDTPEARWTARAGVSNVAHLARPLRF
jgi:ELWxxDGT repeat protein